MAIMRLASSLKDVVLQAIIDAVDGGPAAGTIKFYTAPMPATVDTAITTQTLLGTLTCTDPCATIISHVMTFGTITADASADATGAAAWARVTTSEGVAILDLDVTGIGAGGTVQMNTTAVVAGGPISMSALTVSA